MTESERFEATRLFIAALKNLIAATKPDTRVIPFEPRVFALAVHEEAKKGNSFAEKFQVYKTVAGKSCPDFQQGMTAAQSAGLISRQNPTYQFFSVTMSPRLVESTLSSVETSVSQGVNALAEGYVARVLGA